MWSYRLFQRKGLPVKSVVLTLAAFLCVASVVIAVKPVLIQRGLDYTVESLQLNTEGRGLDSGFSGRIVRWETTAAALSERGIWAFGAGYRTSTRELGFTVDNGYLTVLYENGILALVFIVIQLSWCLWITTRRYLIELDPYRRKLFMLYAAILVAFLVNNFFDRYLFGLGNPFSLLALFFFLVDKAHLRRDNVAG
ncbi:MAG: hypothetical protein P8018_09855 [Acidobacteriota bacterium]